MVRNELPNVAMARHATLANSVNVNLERIVLKNRLNSLNNVTSSSTKFVTKFVSNLPTNAPNMKCKKEVANKLAKLSV